MNEFLPVFPLQLVVFPHEQLNLHIFEPRYKQLIGECEQDSSTFGIPAFIDGEVKDIGAEIQLLDIEKRYDNGELDIRTQGIGLFRIVEFLREVPEKLYSGAEIERLEFSMDGDPELNKELLELIRQLFGLLHIARKLPDDPCDFNCYEVAHHIGLTLQQEYELQIIPDEKARQMYLKTHLEKLIPAVQEMERLQKKVKMNGHFKNIIPPEF